MTLRKIGRLPRSPENMVKVEWIINKILRRKYITRRRRKCQVQQSRPSKSLKNLQIIENKLFAEYGLYYYPILVIHL